MRDEEGSPGALPRGAEEASGTRHPPVERPLGACVLHDTKNDPPARMRVPRGLILM